MFLRGNIKVQVNLPHLPTSAYYHQDIILHIQVVYQWQVRSMHSLIRVWFLNPFRLPNCHFYTECCWLGCTDRKERGID